MNPRCRDCRKRLAWEYPRARTRQWAQYRRRWAARIAIRCLDCRGTFCPRCARRHFAPIMRAQRTVDRVLEQLAGRALRAIKLHVKCPPAKGTQA
jgi:hypothetical protein